MKRAACKRGHDLTDSRNVYVAASGSRQCKPCTIIRNGEWKRRWRRERGVPIFGSPQHIANQRAKAMRDEPGYRAAHKRVLDARGPAGNRTCVCGRRAQQWALDHAHPTIHFRRGAVGSHERTHSLDPMDYMAMCRPCHARFDRRITDTDVIEIRRLYASGAYFHRDLGAMFGIDASTVCRIVTGKGRFAKVPA